MDTFLPKFLDAILRRHPMLMWCSTLLLAIIACMILLASGSSHLVYEGF